jgi:hypothetical protein
MSNYRQGKFRNSFEERLFETVRDAFTWCIGYVVDKDFPRPIKGEVYHNVQTAEFHGELSRIDTFANPQSREIAEFAKLMALRSL